jgi:phosphatidylserine decarboxylase
LEGPAFHDDGGISSDDGEGNSEDEEDESATEGLLPISPLAFPDTTEQQQQPPLQLSQLKPPPPRLDLPASPSTPTPGALTKTPVPIKSGVPGFIPKIFPRRHPFAPSVEAKASPPTTPGAESFATLSPHTPTPTMATQQRSASLSPEPTGVKKRPFKKKWSSKKPDYNFSAENDIVGIVMLEIRGASDLPKLKNSALPLFLSSLLLC